jgi:hypothetical protein
MVRWQAALADRASNRDMAWARQDASAQVRYVAAVADRKARRDLAWASRDEDVMVRWQAAKAAGDRKEQGHDADEESATEF